MRLKPVIVVESLLGKDDDVEVPVKARNGNGNGNGNGKHHGPEVEYDDIEAPRGHVVKSKRSSMILSGELALEPQRSDRAVTVEPSVAFGTAPGAAAASIARAEAEAELDEHTAQMVLITRPRSGGGMLGVLIGAVIVAGVAVGAWYIGRSSDKDNAAAATQTQTQTQTQTPTKLPPATDTPPPPTTQAQAPVVTPVAPTTPTPTTPTPTPTPTAETETGTGTETGTDTETEPAPEPAPAKTEVTIRFSSTPDGAEVRVVGAKKRLGITPFEASFPRVEGAQAFEFRKKGYDTMTGQVALDVDSALTVALSKTGHRRPHGNPGTPTAPSDDPALDRGGTMDVLGDEH